MSRNAPNVLIENVNRTTYISEQILEADGIWAVFYNGRPISLKSQHHLSDDGTSKYKKTSFPNPGHALNLCKKLNAKFKTDRFTVVQLSGGTTVYPATSA